MNITVWTTAYYRGDNRSLTKCIFKGEVSCLPPIGSNICINKNGVLEKVIGINIDLIDDSAEITIDNNDYNDNYKEISL